MKIYDAQIITETWIYLETDDGTYRRSPSETRWSQENSYYGNWELQDAKLSKKIEQAYLEYRQYENNHSPEQR